jgi:hypothetical protein
MIEVVDSTCIKLAFSGKIVLLDSPRFGVPKSTVHSSVKFDITVSADPSDRRSTPWVCGLSLGLILGSNPAGGMDVCLL